MTDDTPTGSSHDHDHDGEPHRTTMADVDHTHPYDDRSFGAMFRRGPIVAADGGRADADRDSNDPSPEETARDPVDETGRRIPEQTDRMDQTMKDVSHTPPDGDDVNSVFERGPEEAEKTTASDTDDGDAT